MTLVGRRADDGLRPGPAAAGVEDHLRLVDHGHVDGRRVPIISMVLTPPARRRPALSSPVSRLQGTPRGGEAIAAFQRQQPQKTQDRPRPAPAPGARSRVASCRCWVAPRTVTLRCNCRAIVRSQRVASQLARRPASVACSCTWCSPAILGPRRATSSRPPAAPTALRVKPGQQGQHLPVARGPGFDRAACPNCAEMSPPACGCTRGGPAPAAARADLPVR